MGNEERARFGGAAQRLTSARPDRRVRSPWLKIHVVGKMSPPNAWIDREGKAQASLEMKVSQITFLSTKGEAGADSGATAAPQQGELHEEDIPF